MAIDADGDDHVGEAAPPPGPHVIAAGSTRGRFSYNEDGWLATSLSGDGVSSQDLAPPGDTALRSAVLGVFDGAGGYIAGRVCSGLAGDEVVKHLRAAHLRETDLASWGPALRGALAAASLAIFERASADVKVRGGHSTAAVAVVLGSFMVFGHVGNSRVYLLRGGELRALTRDHTFGNDPEASARLIPENAGVLGKVITRALGVKEHLALDGSEIQSADLRDGDVLLLCTDGLWEAVPEQRILEVLLGGGSPGELCAALDAACGEGRPSDDRTMVVARFSAGSPSGADEGW